MKKLIFIAMIGFISCTSQSRNETTVDNDTIPRIDTLTNPSVQHVNNAFDTIHRYDYTVYEEVVPKKALNILKEALPDWRLPDPKSFEALWFNYYKKDDVLVNYIHGDFNCDTIEDYVFILENPGTNGLAAWAFQSAGSEHKASELEVLNRDERYISHGLGLVSRGERIQDFDAQNEVNTNEIIKLLCEAIRVQNLEGPSRIYYWNKDKFVKIFETD